MVPLLVQILASGHKRNRYQAFITKPNPDCIPRAPISVGLSLAYFVMEDLD